jgi:hypothetical protein
LLTRYAVMLNWGRLFKGDCVIWTAWKNGKHGRTNAGYGFRVSPADRDQHFNRKWLAVDIDLPHGDAFITVRVNVDGLAFWGNCCELRSTEIRQWLYLKRYAPWPVRTPPKFEVEYLRAQHFRLIAKL